MNKVILFAIVGVAAIIINLYVSPMQVNAEESNVEIIAQNGKQLNLNQKSFYVNSSLEADDATNFKFKTIHSAVAAAVDGTETEPMVIYIEPDVYQMNGILNDRGLYVDKDWVSFIGLTTDAQDVVIADNRGHTIGAQSSSGNSPAESIFITGTGFHAENLTIGNYCNVDLVYPKDTTKNQPMRSSTVTQAYCIGASNKEKTLDKYYFKNVRLISMLDTLALGEVQRIYFEDCYVQGTDDYMGGGNIQVMKNSILHCYSGKPIYAAGKNGMAFIDCKWEVDFADEEDLTITKNSSTLYLINNEFTDLNGKLKSVKWAPYPASNVKCYTSNITLSGEPYTILPEQNSIGLTHEQLKAYSVYNLLRGSDDWDPANEKETYSTYGELPINISITKNAKIRTGEDSAELTARVYPASASQNITWSIDSKYAILSSDKGTTINIKGKNTEEKPVDVVVTATADNGISNQCIVTVYPSFIDSPSFVQLPVVSEPQNGSITAYYKLDLRYEGGIREDQSNITWYRCDDEKGTNPIELAVSRFNKALTSYTLTSGDVGHYIMVSVAPKHLRSHAGQPVTAISSRAITMDDIKGTDASKYDYSTNFENFSTAWQPELIDGTWTIDAYYPLDQQVSWEAATTSPWEYTKGINGADKDNGLLTTGRGARILYTQDKKFGDMAINLTLDTEKIAAQGFGSANGQYLEIYIKYDTETKTGYALRIERTTKYGFATDFTLYEYIDGVGRPISESVSTTAFNPGCTIDLLVEDGVLYAKATSTTPQSSDQIKAGLQNEVSLSAEILENYYGGVGIQHTGTMGAGNRTQLKSITISYKNILEEPNIYAKIEKQDDVI
jgi:hypothetical protein